MGNRSLLLERRKAGAGESGMMSISGFETISGSTSDSVVVSAVCINAKRMLPTLIADEKHPPAVFGNTQGMILHAG